MISINLSNVIDFLAKNDCPFLGHPCFQNKCFAVFRGCKRCHWGAEACPFLGHPCFQNKCFAVFRT